MRKTYEPRTLADYQDLINEEQLRNMGSRYRHSGYLESPHAKLEEIYRSIKATENGDSVSNEYIPTENDNSSPKFSREEYESARRAAADSVAEVIENDYPLKSVFVEHDRVGPMGGTSSQVTVVSEGDSPDVVINIYSDATVQDKVDSFLKRKQQELLNRKHRKETLADLRELEEE